MIINIKIIKLLIYKLDLFKIIKILFIFINNILNNILLLLLYNIYIFISY